jgi:bacillolysin
MQVVSGARVAPVESRLEAMLADDRLRHKYVREDALLSGRWHERLAQHHKGVPVWAAEVTRQRGESGTVSIFGAIHEGIPADLEVTPRVSMEAARSIASTLAKKEIGPLNEAELVIFPAAGGTYHLAWDVSVMNSEGLLRFFIDARTGEELYRYDNLQTQLGPVGLGTGVLGDRKKLAVAEEGSSFYAFDELRPPVLVTYDLKGDATKVDRFLSGFIGLSVADVAQDVDNEWTDAPTVDAHAYAGYTYDYYYKVHNRRGLDGNDLPIRSIVNPARRSDYARLERVYPEFFTNAFWYSPARIMVYGVGAPSPVDGQSWNHVAGSLDVVAHELTHGVTQFSSNLVYQGESGALNEAFSDIMSACVQFYFDYPSANWIVGDEIVVPGGIRSLQNPFAFRDPDHYNIRYTGSLDNGGVHINSGIPNHAFFLAVEGGTNRFSQQRVTGVGRASLEKVEKAFFRAFTRMLTPRASFADARAATIQSARDLYGASDASVTAITQAWSAVGVN